MLVHSSVVAIVRTHQHAVASSKSCFKLHTTCKNHGSCHDKFVVLASGCNEYDLIYDSNLCVKVCYNIVFIYKVGQEAKCKKLQARTSVKTQEKERTRFVEQCIFI